MGGALVVFWPHAEQARFQNYEVACMDLHPHSDRESLDEEE